MDQILKTAAVVILLVVQAVEPQPRPRPRPAHVRDHFLHPAVIGGDVYRTPQAPGCSCDMVGLND